MEPTVKILAFVHTIMGLLGCISNIIQLVLIFRHRHENNSVFRLVVLSLNLADLLASTLTTLRGIIAFVTLHTTTSHKVLDVIDAAIIFSLTSSFTHLIFIAFQRVIAVTRPLQVKNIITKLRSYRVLIILWLISIAPAVLRYIFKGKIIMQVLSYIALVIGMSLLVMYSVICYKTIKRDIVNNENEAMQKRRQQSEKKLVFYSLTVTIVFIVCVYPLALVRFFEVRPTSVYIGSNLLFSLNPFLDTLLYFTWSYHRRRTRVAVHNVPQQQIK